MKISELKPDQKNPRIHGKRNLDLIERSLRELGAARLIVIDEENNIIAGNGTVEGAIRIGMEDVQIIDTDGTKLIAVRVSGKTAEEKTRLAILDNRTAELAEWDEDVLKGLNEAGVLDDMFTGKELEGMGIKEEIVEDEVPETPKEAKTVKGDLYELGRHRVLCGDSTNSDDVRFLMHGAKADMVFTSPQYNAGDNSLGGNKNKVDSKYENDSDAKTQKEYLDLLNGFIGAWMPFSEYLFVNIQMLAGNKVAVLEWIGLMRGSFVDVCVWVKGGGRPAMARNVFNSRFEFVFIFKNENNPKRSIDIADFHGNISNVFELNPSGKNEFSGVHAATFPVEFASHFLKLATKTKIVSDAFMGTGSTLIAAEQTNRICYGMEIEPKYCDIIVSRYCKFTGNNKIKLNGEEIEWTDALNGIAT